VPNDIDNEYYKVLIESWVTGGVDMAERGRKSFASIRKTKASY
jgi:hypothetical protein